jgi:hypothetical protein
VSPVRVRVSPSQAPGSRIATRFSSRRCNGRRPGGALHTKRSWCPRIEPGSAPTPKRLQNGGCRHPASPAPYRSKRPIGRFRPFSAPRRRPDEYRLGRRHDSTVKASHASFLSHPDAVDKLIVQAAKSVH